ncbi:MAG: outer membrane beta-barrel protein [Acidiferrobacter sp.]
MRKTFAVIPAALCGLALAGAVQAAINLPAATTFDAGPLGSLSVQGIVSGLGTLQSDPQSGAALGANRSAQFDINNAQFILQKTSGLVQFYIQAGAYNFPTLGEPIVPTGVIMNDEYGPVPEAYITIAPSSNFSVEVGKLPTLMGAELTWSWMNQNIARGLLWNDENAVNRGVQANVSHGPFALSLSLNDGFYSNDYDVITGLGTYTINPNSSASVFFYQPLRTMMVSTVATSPVLNNSRIYNIMYNDTIGPWTLSPYLQYIYSPTSTKLGYTHAEHADGAAMIANYQINPTWSMAGRAEYETSTGASSTASGNSNILGFGPGSKAWSLTITPTYQDKGFFTRVELSYVHVINPTSGDVFGATGANANQVRGMIETGIMF